MSRLATISLNFSDGEKEYIHASDNPLIIITKCIMAAAEGKTIYSIINTCLGYEIERKRPDYKYHEYVSCFRKGEYTWHSDSLYAKHYSFDKAVEHVLELYGRDKA